MIAKKETDLEFDARTGLIWPTTMDHPVAGLTRESFATGEPVVLTEEQIKLGRLMAVSPKLLKALQPMVRGTYWITAKQVAAAQAILDELKTN